MGDQNSIFSSGGANGDALNADKTVYIPRPGALGGSPAHAPNAPTTNIDQTINNNHSGFGSPKDFNNSAGFNGSASFNGTQGYQDTFGHNDTISQQLPMQGAMASNPLVQAASTLLRVIHRLRHTPHHQHVQILHQNLVRSIKTFDLEIKNAQIRPEISLSARYMLCSTVDECVLNTPWGSQSQWSRHSLLSVFHKETFGGEKFYLILSRMLEAPAKNIMLLELAYLLLSLGFEGKYKVDPRGRDKIENIRDRLFTTIEQIRGEFSSELAPNAVAPMTAGKRLTDYIPLWVITVCALALMLVCYGGFKLWLHETADLTSEHINQLSTELDENSHSLSKPKLLDINTKSLNSIDSTGTINVTVGTDAKR